MSPNSVDGSWPLASQRVDSQPSHRGERADHIDVSRIPSNFSLLSLSITTVHEYNVYYFHRIRLSGRFGRGSFAVIEAERIEGGLSIAVYWS